MEYVEILRARRVLIWYAVAVVATAALNLLSLHGHVTVQSSDMDIHGKIPLAAILVGSAFVAFILASCVAPGLSNEGNTTAISWTRPMPRWVIALRYVAVDVSAIALGYAMCVATVLGILAFYGLGRAIAIDSYIPDGLALALGTVVMWYGLLVAASARFPGRGGMIAGLSWGAVFVLAVLGQLPLPWLIHDLVVALNYLNPAEYINGAANSHANHVVALTGVWREIVPWCIGIAGIVAGIRLWSTREA
jgi:hypothetical protein